MTEKKKKIIGAALEMFSDNGYKGTATNQIAKKAKVSEGLIFIHFKNKEGSLEGVLGECEKNISKIFDPLNDLKHPKVLLKNIISIPFNTSKENIMYCKLLNKLSKDPINPLIGAAGVSAVPMAARVVSKVGNEEDSSNVLLMHAMGPNVSGVVGSAVAAGVLISIFA